MLDFKVKYYLEKFIYFKSIYYKRKKKYIFSVFEIIMHIHNFTVVTNTSSVYDRL